MTTKNQNPGQRPPVLAFIDAIENGVARLLVRGAPSIETWQVPAALLPADAVEGKWIEVQVRTVPTPAGEDPAGLRRKLGASDPGGDIVL